MLGGGGRGGAEINGYHVFHRHQTSTKSKLGGGGWGRNRVGGGGIPLADIITAKIIFCN